MFLWIKAPIVRLHVGWGLKHPWELYTHYIREGHLIIIIYIMTWIMPSLMIKTSYLRGMRLSIFNTMWIFTMRFPSVFMFPITRSVIALRTLSLVITLSSALVLVIAITNSVIPSTSFISSSHLLQVLFQLSDTLSLLFHHETISSYEIWFWGTRSILDARGFLGGSNQSTTFQFPASKADSYAVRPSTYSHCGVCFSLIWPWAIATSCWRWEDITINLCATTDLHKWRQCLKIACRILGNRLSKLRWGLLRTLHTMVIRGTVESHDQEGGCTCKNFDDQVSQSKRYQLFRSRMRTYFEGELPYL